MNTKLFPDTKHVKQGVLVQTSPSAIEAWDETTSFGCQRKWHFQYIQGMKGEETASQQLGTALHGAVEDYIDERKVASKRSEQVIQLFLAVKPTVDEIIEEGIVAVESWMDLELAGVKIVGRIDIRKARGILDWKTSSDIGKYAKTPGQLRRSTQMLLYAKWLEGQLRDDGLIVDGPIFPLELEHVYVQTKGKPLVERVKAKIDKGSLDVGIDGIILLVEEMKVAAGETDVSKLKADRSKCRMCSFNAACPKENTTMANLLSRLKSASAPETAPKSTDSEGPAFSVLPPDAPKSDPAHAASPVPGFGPLSTASALPELLEELKVAVVEATPTAPEPAAPGRRGRPPGAKNKMKFVDIPEALLPSPSPVDAKVEAALMSALSSLDERKLQEAAAAEYLRIETKRKAGNAATTKVEYQSVTVAFGATIPTAQFANQRMDVTLTARFTGDVNAATEEVSAKVRALVIKELEKISLTLAGPALNPGGKP